MASATELIDIWERTGNDLADLLDSLGPEDWGRPTALPGWTVRDTAAHVISLERSMATDELPSGELDPVPAHVTNDFQRFTELGVRAQDDKPSGTLGAELRRLVAESTGRLRADPPDDLSAKAPIGFAPLLGWSWGTALGNRAVDFWFHEQDIRAAVGRPGGTEGAGAAAVLAQLQGGLGMVVGKRARPTPGTVVRFIVTGPVGFNQTLAVDNDGRARPSQGSAEPDVTLTMDVVGFQRLVGGRGPAEEVAVDITGDDELGRRILGVMTITP